jgi:hypothetical protein
MCGQNLLSDNRVMRIMFMFLFAACAGGSESTPSSAAGTGDTSSVPTVPVLMTIYEEDRQCFGQAVWELPEEYWAQWSYSDPYTQCEGLFKTPLSYSTTDGHCLKFANPLQGFLDGLCDVDDPWIRPCSALPGCCERDLYGCSPLDYEP